MADIIRSLMQISWQAALLAAVVWLITRIGSKAPAAWRHALWVVVLVKLFVPPFAHLPLLPATHLAPQMRSITAPDGNAMTKSASDSPAQRTQDNRIPSMSYVLTLKDNADAQPLMLALGMIWAIGIVAMAARFTNRYRKQKGILAGSLPATSNLSNLLSECASRLGMERLPEIRMAESAAAPMLLGVFHPTILVHPDMAGMRCQSELSVMIMHELAHVRRRDTMVSWAVQTAQALFFFHPAVWLAGREIRKERELAADEMVLSASGIDRFEYASGYIAAVRLANGFSIGDTALAMAESTEIEERRLKMILRSAVPRMSWAWITGFVVVAAVGLTTFRSLAGSNLSSAQAIGKAMEAQQSLAGNLVVQYALQTEGNHPNYKGQIHRRVVRYIRSPKGFLVFLAEYSGQIMDSGDWVDDSEGGGKYSYDMVSREGRSMGSKKTQEIIKGDDPSREMSDPTLMETVSRNMAPMLLYQMVRECGSVVGQEDVDGHSCIKLKLVYPIPAPLLKGTKPMSHMVWVDPSIGFCPRRIDYFDGSRISTMSDYKELSAGVWFPMTQSTLVTYSDRRRVVWVAKVLDAKANVPLKEGDMKVSFDSTKKVFVKRFH